MLGKKDLHYSTEDVRNLVTSVEILLIMAKNEPDHNHDLKNALRDTAKSLLEQITLGESND